MTRRRNTTPYKYLKNKSGRGGICWERAKTRRYLGPERTFASPETAPQHSTIPLGHNNLARGRSTHQVMTPIKLFGDYVAAFKHTAILGAKYKIQAIPAFVIFYIINWFEILSVQPPISNLHISHALFSFVCFLLYVLPLSSPIFNLQHGDQRHSKRLKHICCGCSPQPRDGFGKSTRASEGRG